MKFNNQKVNRIFEEYFQLDNAEKSEVFKILHENLYQGTTGGKDKKAFEIADYLIVVGNNTAFSISHRSGF